MEDLAGSAFSGTSGYKVGCGPISSFAVLGWSRDQQLLRQGGWPQGHPCPLLPVALLCLLQDTQFIQPVHRVPSGPWLSGPMLHRPSTSPALQPWVGAPLSQQPPQSLPESSFISPLARSAEGERSETCWLLCFRSWSHLCSYRSHSSHRNRIFFFLGGGLFMDVCV